MNNLVSDEMPVFEDSYNENTIVTKYFEDPNNYVVKKLCLFYYSGD